MKMKGTYLKEIVETTRRDVSKKKKSFKLSELRSLLNFTEPTRGFRDRIIKFLEEKSVAVIAEMKKASPSKGIIRENYDPLILAKSYQDFGATCLSVLTNKEYFQGSLDHITQVKEVVQLPVLRKDFIVDKYQIYESLYRGADCILLIVAALSRRQLKEYYQLAIELGLDVLVEVHTHMELEQALEIEPIILGINNRNLETFEINLETTKNLVKEIPDNILIISESGIKTKEDINKITSYGVNTFLVGEALMRNNNPGKKLKNLFYS